MLPRGLIGLVGPPTRCRAAAVTVLATVVVGRGGAVGGRLRPGRGRRAHRPGLHRLVQRPGRPRPGPGRRPHRQAAGHRGRARRGWWRSPARLAAAACVPLSLASGWRAGVAHLVAVAGGWAYDLGLKRTVWSWLPVRRELRPADGLHHARACRAPRPRRPGWWRRARCSASARTSSTSCPTSRRPGGRRPRAAAAAGCGAGSRGGCRPARRRGRRRHSRPRAAAVVGLGRARRRDRVRGRRRR